MIGWYIFAGLVAFAVVGNVLWTFIVSGRVEDLEETVYEDPHGYVGPAKEKKK